MNSQRATGHPSLETRARRRETDRRILDDRIRHQFRRVRHQSHRWGENALQGLENHVPNPGERYDPGLDLRAYLEILWRRKWVILITLVATMGLVGVGTYFSTPIYAATALVRVAPGSGAYFDYADYLYGETLRNTYREVATTSHVLEQVGLKLDAVAPPRVEQIEVSVVEDTELIELRVTDPDPRYAAAVANTLAQTLIAEGRLLSPEGEGSLPAILGSELDQVELEILDMQAEYDELLGQASSDLDRIGDLARRIRLKQDIQATLMERYQQARIDEVRSQNTVSLIDPAATPTTPVRPRPTVNMAAAGAVGLMSGVALAFLFNSLDREGVGTSGTR